jgi:hypothetical protein
MAQFFRLGKDGGELLPLPEYAQEGFGFPVRQPDQPEFGEDDGPGEDGKEEEDEENDFHHRARVKDQVHDAPPEAATRGGGEKVS